MSIPNVAHTPNSPIYHPQMPKATPAEWASRFETMRKERGIDNKDLAAKMDITAPGLRHWLNGHRQITLQQFLDLCKAAKFDPVEVLFGAGYITDEIRERVSGLSRMVLEAKPLPYRVTARKKVRT